MPLFSFGTDSRPARKRPVKKARPEQQTQIARLRQMAAEIEHKMQIARVAANQMGKDVALLRDSFGRLRMVFVQSLEAGEQIAANVQGKDMGSEVNHLGGFRERGPRLGAWPAQGYAFPTRGFIVPSPRGYAIPYTTHPIPRSRW